MLSAPLLIALAITAPYQNNGAAARAVADGAADSAAALEQLRRSGRHGLWALDGLRKKERGERKGRLLDAIGTFDTPEAQYVLKKEIKSADPEARAGAIRGLGHFRSTRLKRYLIRNADSSHAVVRDAVLAAMIETGPKLLDDARALLRSKNPGARSVGLAYVAKYDRSTGAQALSAALSDRSVPVRVRAAELIGAHQMMSLAAGLEPLLRDDDEQVALAAVKSVVALWTRSTARLLSTIIADPKTREPVWRRGAHALLERGDRGSFVALARGMVRAEPSRRQVLSDLLLDGAGTDRIGGVVSLLSAGAEVQPLARQLLKRVGETAEDAAIARLEGADPLTRRAIVTFLATCPKDRVGRKLLAGTRTGAPAQRAAVIGLIAEMVDPSVVPDLITLSKDGAPAVRAAAVRAIGPLDSKDIRAALSARLQDEEAKVRIAALEGLAQVDSPAREALILKALEDPDRDVRLAAVAQLTPARDRKTLLVLQGRLDRVDQVEREAIVRAISDSRLPESSTLLVDLVTHRDPEIRKAALHVVNEER